MNKDCFTPKVLEADCDNTPITFLTTEIEGVDDTVNPPLNGAYNNTIVKYLMTGHIYLYNSVGIPTLLNESSKVDDELSLDSTNPVQNKVITAALNKGVEDLQNEVEAREAAIAALQELLDNKVDKVDGKGLSTNDYTNADKNIVDGIESKLDQDVINSIQISSNTSTDVLVLEDGKVNLWTGSTNTHEVPLPVASTTSAGVMNASTFNAVAENSNKITNILQGTVAITGLSATPTQEELTTQWKTASGETDLINGARIYDVTNHVNWTYYSNLNEWLSAASGGESVSVNTWTNTAAGIIKGSTEDGQLFAESDGTGSVNGWDTVKSDIANNASNLTTLSATVTDLGESINSLQTDIGGKQDTLVSGTNIKTINGESILGEGDLDVQSSSIKNVSANFSIESGTSNVERITMPTTAIPSYTTSQWFTIGRAWPATSTVYLTSDTKINVAGTDMPLYVRNPYDIYGASPIVSNVAMGPSANFLIRFMSIPSSSGLGTMFVCVLESLQDPASQNVYSTNTDWSEPAKIGMFGAKSIYIQVITGTTPSTAGGTWVVLGSIGTNKDILSICGAFYKTNGEQNSIPTAWTSENVATYYNKSNGNVYIRANYNYALNAECRLTVVYISD